MFSSERASQLSNTTSKVQWPLRFAFSYVSSARYTALQPKNSRSASAILNPITTKVQFARPNYQLSGDVYHDHHDFQNGRMAYFDVSVRSTTQPSNISSCAGVAAAAGELGHSNW